MRRYDATQHTHRFASSKGLRGWCRNMPSGTVAGKAEGDLATLAEFKAWLSTRGSPKSRIDRAVFENEQAAIEAAEFDDFRIIR